MNAFLIAFSLVGFSPQLALTTQTSVKVWISLAWKRINFLGFEDKDCAKLMISASQSAISSKCYHSHEQPLDYSVPVHVAENETTLLGLLENSNVPAHSILYEVQDKDLRGITSILENLDLSKSFFLLHMKNNTTKSDLYNVHTFKENKLVSMVKWTLNPTNVYFKEEFNLKGAVLRSSTLSWPPYVEVGKCNDGNKNCQVSGIVPDILSLFGLLFNFTVSYDKTSSGLWGTESNKNDNSFGYNCEPLRSNIGEIAHGAYDFSGAQWNVHNGWTCSVEFSKPCLIVSYKLFVNHVERGKMDDTLLLRPFNQESWMALIILTGIFFCCFCLRHCTSIEHDSRMIHTPFWIMFLLLHAFYTGAMTMFFAGPTKLPFNNISDAVQLFPKWKPVLQSGMDMSLERELPQDISDELFVQMRNDNLFKPNIREVLEHMEKNVYLYTLADRCVILYELNKRQYAIDFHSFDLKGFPAQAALLLGKFSPYTRMFNKGIQHILETGILNSVITSKLRDLQSSHSTTGKLALGWHHLAPGILFYMAALMLIPGIVLMEISYQYIKKKLILKLKKLIKTKS